MSASELVIGPQAEASRARPLLAGDAGLRIFAGIAILLLWEIAVRLWAPAYVAKPTGVVLAVAKVFTNPTFWNAAGLTLSAVAQGLLIAFVAGTVVGAVMGRMRMAETLLQPYVNGFFAMPMIAILPLVTIWFGYTGDARLATIVFAAFFSIALNVADGARSTPPEYVEVSRAFRGSGWSRLMEVILPSSMPYLLAGLRLAAGRAVIGAVVAEFYVALPGLGYFILFHTRTFRHDEAFVAVAVLAGACVLFELGLTKATTRFLPWYRRDEFKGDLEPSKPS
jgi:ABC-type nitrate/sulfonate/bicarbonate transport system permease component